MATATQTPHAIGHTFSVEAKAPSKRDIVYAVLSRALRDQLGEATFDRILSVHKTAIAFREAHADADAQRKLKADLERLLAVPLPQQLHIIRAFSYFSQLLNISEDVDEVRKLRSAAATRRHDAALATGVDDGAPPPPRGSVDAALLHVAAAGVKPERVIAWFTSGNVMVAPVLTAHPTEVQRKTILDLQHEIARLLQVSAAAGACQ